MKSKLMAQANAIGATAVLTVPFEVLLKEGALVAKRLREYWEEKDHRPGMASAARKVPLSMADEIVAVRDMAQDAQSEYLMFIEPGQKPSELSDRAKVVLYELKGVIDFHLDDGVEDENDAKFAALNASHENDGESAATLSQALHDYATLARPMADDLDGLGNFDASIIEEAFMLADQLGESPVVGNVHSSEAKALKDKRDHLALLLMQKIRLVRAAARFVFRDYPAIRHQFASAHERHRRAAAKRIKAADGTTGQSGI
ncbi:MAG: hypothetical protein JXR76_26245 [Deltaproteobacteria bacterium]|nr:hypothetical protein [Deltaproteobacteria bacterium]